MEATAGALRKTPLNALHRESGAKMVAFGGWEMPVEYSGLIREHLAVRKSAGLFDVSHMGQLEVLGPAALAFLQRVTANNVAKLADGQAQYSALPLANGAPVDDVIVSRRSPERFLLVVNRVPTPGRGELAYQRLTEVARQHVGVELHYLGEIPDDDSVMQHRLGQLPLVAINPEAPTSAGLRGMTERLHQLCGGLQPREIAGDQGIEARFRQHRLFL